MSLRSLSRTWHIRLKMSYSGAIPCGRDESESSVRKMSRPYLLLAEAVLADVRLLWFSATPTPTFSA
ncbi:hypothetical protein BQ8794_180030 [Mesorhizobium prunaredense]|uniref:Uncharacterized protein n=1 Tax=Mesorhizobium prunaredense TaxID=1631249 RepID=A0A1R3V7B8_9HYPH|nr:hypothetical protein BQ8794_180030 [Mesorhizobium prunaredense]